MIINQTGVSAPFVFAGTGDTYVVAGAITNLGSPTSSVIRSGRAGETITNYDLASFGAGDAITLAGGGTVANSGLISGAITASSTLTFANTGRFAGFVAGTQNALSAGSVITNRGTMVFADAPGNSVHSPNAVIALGAGNDTVTNSGKVVGDIHLGQGDNVFDGQGGTLLGTVFAGLGNDTFYLRRP